MFLQPWLGRGCRIDVRDMEEDLARVTRNADQLSILEAKVNSCPTVPLCAFFMEYSLTLSILSYNPQALSGALQQWGTSSPIKKFFPWFSFLRGCQMFLSTWGASFEAFARKRSGVSSATVTIVALACGH